MMLGFDPLDSMKLEDAFELAEREKLWLEVQLEPPYAFDQGVEEKIRALHETHSSVPLVLHAPYREVYLSSVESVVRRAGIELYRRTLALAADVGASVVMHVGNVSNRVPPDIALENVASALNTILREAKELGVRVALENDPPFKHFLLRHPSDFFSLFSHLGRELPLCLDVAHAYGNGDLDAFLDLLGERVEIYHLSDTVRGKDLHLPLGEGEILWKSVLTRLNREKPWILEVWGQDAILKSLNFLHSLL